MDKFFEKDHKNDTDNDKTLNSKKFTEIQVIGAGLPRTGTLSLKTALTQLYGGKCYHMMSVMSGKQEDVDIWIRASKGEVSKEEFREFFSSGNYACGVDFPFSGHYKELMAAYPEAKVVLSVRDPSTWHGSVYNSIDSIGRMFNSHPSARWLIGMLDGRKRTPFDMIDVMNEKCSPGCQVSFKEAIDSGPAVAEQYFNDWVAEVKRSVPAERLLVHSAKQGWEPLCRFLDLPVPEGPYPRVNDTASIQKMVNSMWWANCLLCYCLPAALAVAAACYVSREDLAPLGSSLLEAASKWCSSLSARLSAIY